MIRAIRPSAVARDDASLIGGWNIAPNVGYTISLSVSASAVVVILASLDGATLIGSGLALVGVDQPVTITPVSGQTIGMVDADLGWHMLVTTDGTEGERSIVMDPMVDLADEIHPVYTDDSMALARATAAINAGASYVDDVTVACPRGIGGGIGAVASAPVDGVAVVGQVESVTWSGTPDGTIETAVIRRHTAIAPAAYTPPAAPPVLADDVAETDAATTTSGNVLANDIGILVVVAVNGLTANVGQIVAGSDGGEFVVNADGSWTFDPSGDFAALTGSETADTSVTYHVSDGVSEAMGTLTVTVTASSAEYTPLATPGLYFWHDFSDSASRTVDGSYITSIVDKSGNSRSMYQSVSAYRPTIVPGVQNGLDAVVFSGSIDQCIDGTFPVPQGVTYTFVGRTNVASGYRPFIDGISAVWNAGRHFITTLSTGVLSMYSGNSLGAPTAGSIIGVPVIISAHFDGANSWMRLDGVTVATGNAGTLTVSALRYGLDYDKNLSLSGWIGEVIAETSGSVAVAVRNEQYLATKWGLELDA